MKKYLNQKFYDLNKIANQFTKEYINAKPFPHIVFDNFFDEKILNSILNDFPKNLDKTGKVHDHDAEQKLVSDNNLQLSQNIIEFLDASNSEVFVNFLN